jgi:putative two-component system response regulator
MTLSFHELQAEPKILVGLLETSIVDSQRDDIKAIAEQLHGKLPSLLRSGHDEDFGIAVDSARLLAYTERAEPVEKVIHIFIDVAAAHIPRGATSKAIFLVEKAIELATKNDLQPELRRACSVYALMSTDVGLPARAIEYALRAASIAQRLGVPSGVAAAFSNMTAALFVMGLYRETIAVALRLIARFQERADCSTYVGIAKTNMASAALALQNYSLAAESAEQACEAMGLPRDAQSVMNRMSAEGTWLKSAIGLNQSDIVASRLKMINGLADAFKSTRLDLNRKLAEAAHEIFAGDLTIAVTKLLELHTSTKAVSTLHRDTLVLLVRAYEKGNDHSGALLYLGELVEFLGKSQISKVRTLLEAIREQVQTPMPGKDDVREMLENLYKPRTVPRAEIEVPQQLYRDALERLAVSAEMREDSFGRHAYRVGKLAGLLAREVGYDDRFADEIDLAARLHDIGKLGIPDGVLMKPDGLSTAERTVMERHTEIGAQILAQCSHPAFRMAEQIALHHHEKWNGSGYPRRLAGVSIPEVARIAALADVYDALTHVRPYKDAWTHEDAIEDMTKQKGLHFEPRLVDAFVTMITRVRAEHGAAVEDYLAEAGNASTFLQARDEMHAMLHDVAPLSEGELL